MIPGSASLPSNEVACPHKDGYCASRHGDVVCISRPQNVIATRMETAEVLKDTVGPSDTLVREHAVSEKCHISRMSAVMDSDNPSAGDSTSVCSGDCAGTTTTSPHLRRDAQSSRSVSDEWKEIPSCTHPARSGFLTATVLAQGTTTVVVRSENTTHGVNSSDNDNSTPKKIWRKVLFEKQPFEDNYVDKDLFLNELRQNENVRNYHYLDVVKDTAVIAQQIAIVVLFVQAFYSLHHGTLEATTLIYLDCALFAVACIFYVYRKQYGNDTRRPISISGSSALPGGIPETPVALTLDCLRTAVILVFAMGLLAPILSTLTLTYSDDTITALSIITMSLNVITADYTYLNGYMDVFAPNLSINSATFGVVLIASRIETSIQSGSLIAFGALCFVLSPILRHHIRNCSTTVHIMVSIALFIAATLSLADIRVLAVIFVGGTLMITLVITWCFVRLHSSVKYQISGPWDEAKPTNSAAAAEWANAGLLS